MKKFISKFALFITPLVVLFVALEAYVSLTANAFNTKSNYLKKNLKEIEVLILGSSHNQNAINPKHLSVKAANMAYGGQDLNLDSKILYQYLPKLNKLKLVVFELSYHTLEHKNRHNYWRNSHYIRYLSITNFEEINIMHWSMYYSNIVFFNKYLLRKINPNSYRYIINEYGFIENDFPGRFYDLGFDTHKIWKSRSKCGHYIQSVNNFIDNSNILKNMIAYCRQNRIAAIFVSPPVYKTYFEEMVLNKKNRRNEFLQEHSGMIFLNYENSEYFNVKDFKNDDHLNSNGATKFTKLLDGHIASILSN